METLLEKYLTRKGYVQRGLLNPGLPRILFSSKDLSRDRKFHTILKISLRAKKVEDDLI